MEKINKFILTNLYYRIQNFMRASTHLYYYLTNSYEDVDDAIHSVTAEPEDHIAHLCIHVEHRNVCQHVSAATLACAEHNDNQHEEQHLGLPLYKKFKSLY